MAPSLNESFTFASVSECTWFDPEATAIVPPFVAVSDHTSADSSESVPAPTFSQTMVSFVTEPLNLPSVPPVPNVSVTGAFVLTRCASPRTTSPFSFCE